MTWTTSISAASWYPLSAEYQHDDNFDLQPVLIEWKDGYRLFHHPIFQGSKDVALQKHTSFYLSSAGSFFDFIRERAHGIVSLGAYITLSRGGEYVTRVGSDMYLSAAPLSELNFFRIITNSDNTFSFMNGDSKYITVDQQLPFNLTFEDILSVDEIDRQRFKIYTPNNRQVYISTYFDNPNPGYGPVKIERLWSFNPSTQQMRTIGMITDDDYANDNPYLFDVEGYDIIFAISGLTKDQTWVHYYNQLFDKDNNKNVEIDEMKCISAVKINRLIDLPYVTKIDYKTTVGTMKVNIANLKNVMTPEYEYNVRPESFPPVESE